jgi:hypothetical protein
MGLFTLFDPANCPGLNVKQNGWLRPYFTLTNGIDIYGQLSYAGVWRSVGTIMTANQNWTVQQPKLFNRDILINDLSTNETIAVIKTTPWRGRVTLEFKDGQVLSLQRDGLFSRRLFWYHQQYGNVLTVTTSNFSYDRAFEILPGQNIFNNSDYLILLAFISVHIILIRRAAGAAAIR